ncbi:hypothetical protein [Shewanella algae]|uniref:hypothetical protein n=1 Tax=Shewanella algae TaxID=38313 RepID=UPI001AAD5E9B|nr:hypothetical protein [Shewanella algae]MBO2558971.1 hypothetical protein [Shewanella algae]MBO2575876.1 hypothetical protein [Shewanella algae]
MAGTIYLSDREMGVINDLRAQVASLIESGADDDFVRMAEEWFADIDNIERKFRASSTMRRARVIANQIIKS